MAGIKRHKKTVHAIDPEGNDHYIKVCNLYEANKLMYLLWKLNVPAGDITPL